MDVVVGRASWFTRRHAFRLSETVRAGLDRPPVFEDDQKAVRTQVVGLDPVRVLLFGSGPLIGYGVRQRGDAVDGHLARLLARRLGRGVTVESRIRLGLPIRQAVPSLGAAGTVTFSVAVWAPRFGQELEHGGIGRSRTEVQAMLQQFREESDVPLVLCQLPTPLGSDWRTLLRRPRVGELNRVLEQEAEAVRDVVAVRSGTYRPDQAASTVGPEWHRGLAERLAPAVLAAVRGAVPATTEAR